MFHSQPLLPLPQILVKKLNVEVDVKFWSQQLSFILVGLIIVASIRGLLLQITKLFYAVASANSSNVIVLFLAQVMGTYFCAMVILMRMNMPLEYRCVCACVWVCVCVCVWVLGCAEEEPWAFGQQASREVLQLSEQSLDSIEVLL